MNKKENLILGLNNFKEMAETEMKKEQLVRLYSNLEVLIFQAKNEDLWNEVIYPAQSLQFKVMKRILK